MSFLYGFSYLCTTLQILILRFINQGYEWINKGYRYNRQQRY